jgi:hypothetical protein
MKPIGRLNTALVAATATLFGCYVHLIASHVKSVYRKLEVRCAVAAVMRALELRLLPWTWDCAQPPVRTSLHVREN